MNSVRVKSFVLNVMYNGKYLNKNMGHEVINLFKDDNGNNYLYLNPYGNFAKVHQGKVEVMLMVVSVPKRNMFEVVAIATGLKDVFKPTNCFNASLDKSKYTVVNKKAYDKVRQYQLDYIEENKVAYDGIALDKLFTNDQQQAIYITYKAESVIIPEKRTFITFNDTIDLENEDNSECVYVHLESCNQCKMSQKQYVSAEDFSEEKWNELCDKIFGQINYPSNKVTEGLGLIIQGQNRTIQNADSIFDICGMVDNELAFSNALAYYMEKYPSLFKEIFGFRSKNVTVQREYKHIDIFVKDGDRRIIIENKIHSGINGKKSGKGNGSQLDKYWDQVTIYDETPENKVSGYVVCPEYAVNRIFKEKNNCRCGAKYKVVSYKEIWEALKNAKQRRKDGNFDVFVESIRKHTYRSIAEINYERMKNIFLNRILQNSVKNNK